MTGIEPEPHCFQVERNTHSTARATHTKLASFSKRYIFCTKSQIQQNRTLPLGGNLLKLRGIKDKYKMYVQYKGQLHRCSVG